jgi:tRNA (guanine-N7-)-methyltransferase
VTTSHAVLTYNARRGRMRAGRIDALTRLWPRFGLPADGPLSTRDAPLVLEVGSGMGDATVAMAAADPRRDYLAVEVHTAGVANLLMLLEAAGLPNVRVAHGDALSLVRARVDPASLHAVHAFFPDPWPKARHAKRRLIQAPHVALLASRLVVGGQLWCATDSPAYAEEMLAVLSASTLANVHSGFAPRGTRPVTRYERRGLAAGRQSYDLVFRRVR